MAKFIKLPEKLREWKINSQISDIKGNETYKISKKEYDGTVINAELRHISLRDDNYNQEHIELIMDEADFLKTVCDSSNSFNYIDIYLNDNPPKEKLDLYIITEELTSLENVLATKQFSEDEVVDFGIKISRILETLEAKSIYHGNISTRNIYVTDDGNYKLGGFSDFESKISDMSFVAPEIYNKQDADFTTDIYSLGLIMYTMCNNGKLPFEDDNTDAKAACEKRFAESDVEAPANGSRELKSVIVIACKPDNKYRWKNASNIINALSSINSSSAEQTDNKNVITPESTNFDGNVFDEYEYEEFEEEKPTQGTTEFADAVVPAVAGAVVAGAVAGKVIEEAQTPAVDVTDDSDNSDNHKDDLEEKADDNDFETIDPDDSAEEPVENEVAVEPEKVDDEITDSEIFDNYESSGRTNIVADNNTKDYGSYFDDDEPATENNDKTDQKQYELYDENEDKQNDDVTEFDVENDSELNEYEEFDDEESDDEDNEKKSKKSLVIIIVSIVIILSAIGAGAYFAISSGMFDFVNNKSTEAPTTEEPTTVEPTTEEPTTVEPTTSATSVYITPVVGYGYYYAKDLLEAQGFVVEVGNYEYSNYYDAGYVISQTPNGDGYAEKGRVITLDVSLGLIQSTTQAPTEEPTQQATENKTEDTSIFPNSSTSYITKAEVEALNNDQINLAINEIYARNGRIFQDPTLSAYFNSQSWYTPKYTAEEFDKNVKFNEYEQANLQLLVSHKN